MKRKCGQLMLDYRLVRLELIFSNAVAWIGPGGTIAAHAYGTCENQKHEAHKQCALNVHPGVS
jgi:hypothetical protein